MKRKILGLLLCLCLVITTATVRADTTSGSINIEGAVEVVMTVEQDVAVDVRLAWDSSTSKYQSTYGSSSFISKTDGHVLLEGPAATQVSINVPSTVNVGDAVLSLACKYDASNYNDAGAVCATHNLSDVGKGYVTLVPTQVQYQNTNNELGAKTGSVTVTINWN